MKSAIIINGKLVKGRTIHFLPDKVLVDEVDITEYLYPIGKKKPINLRNLGIKIPNSN